MHFWFLRVDMRKQPHKRHWASMGIPEGSRQCRACGATKEYSEFHKHKQCVDGYNTICKSCRRPRSIENHRNKSKEHKLFDAAKSRAPIKGLSFNLDRSDVVIPEICPVFNTPMIRPSLDRIDSAKGYEKGNVRVISWRANMLKNNATREELRLLYEDACRIGTK